MKPDTPIRSIFDNSSDLDIVIKDGEIKSIHGVVEYCNIQTRISIDQKDTGPLYRGTISLIDPTTGRNLVSERRRRERREAGRPIDDRYCYASNEIKCSSSETKKLAEAIQNHVTSLIIENQEQLHNALRTALPPDAITPFLAAELYRKDYLTRAYPDSAMENNNRRAATILKHCTAMPNRPMKDFSPKEMDRFVRTKKLSDDDCRLLSEFWRHCIRTGICTGDLPFTYSPHRRRTSYSSQNRKATTAKTLTPEEIAKAFKFITHETTPIGLHCGFALVASGFEPKDALQKTWEDITFHRSADRAWIRHDRPELAGSIHDFSRPLAPESARFLRKVRDYLHKNYGDDYLAWPIVFDELPPKTEVNTKTLTGAIRNLLIRAGVPNKMFDSGKYSRESVAVKLLHNTYEQQLRFVCGLNFDDDTREYLLGNSLRSSTFASYVSHTDPVAQEYLHTALQPMSVPSRYAAPRLPQSSPGRTIQAYSPDMTNQRVHVTAHIRLRPGENMTIRCPHGVTGTVCAKAANS